MWIFGRRSELSSTPGVTMPSPSGIEWYQLTFAISVWSSSVSTLNPSDRWVATTTAAVGRAGLEPATDGL